MARLAVSVSDQSLTFIDRVIKAVRLATAWQGAQKLCSRAAQKDLRGETREGNGVLEYGRMAFQIHYSITPHSNLCHVGAKVVFYNCVNPLNVLNRLNFFNRPRGRPSWVG